MHVSDFSSSGIVHYWQMYIAGYSHCQRLVSQARPFPHSADRFQYAVRGILKAIGAARKGSGLRD